MKSTSESGQLVYSLNEALNREISTLVRYLVQSSTVHGKENLSVRALYKKEVPEELAHAQYLADKIVMLGGKPKVDPDLSAPPTAVEDMLKRDIAAEQRDVLLYKELAKMAEDAGEIELRVKMEEQAADEARHAEDLQRMQA